MNALELLHTEDLAQRLAEAEATIEALLSGQIDAVVDPRSQTPVLLFKAQAALRESEERYRALFDFSPLPKWLYDVQTLRFLEVNDAAVRHYGYSREEFLSMTINDVGPAQDPSAPIPLESLPEEAANQGTWKHRKKDGTPIDVEVTGHVLSIEGRNCRLVVLNDVTERKRAELALHVSEARFARLWDSGIIGIYIADFRGRVLEANDASLRMLGCSREELLSGSVSWEELTPPEWKAHDQRALDELVATGVAQPWEKEFVRKDGTRLPALIGVAALDHPNCIVFLADLTALKRAEKELRERVEIAALSADVGMAVTQADSLRDMLQRCAEAVAGHLGAAFTRIWTLNAEQGVLELQAGAGQDSQLDGKYARVPVGQLAIGKIAEDRKPHSTNDVLSDPVIAVRDWAHRAGMVAFAGHPLLIAGELVGVMALFAGHPLSDAVLRALAASANAIAVGIRAKTVESAKSVLEAQLRQAQKIEAIGQLTGGIAHDFNNMLSVILSRAFFLIEELGERDPRREDAEQIKIAAEHAASLTRQLLAFSRKQVLDPRVLDLSAILEGLEKMLGRLIGEDIALSIEAAKDLGSVKADAGQFEQVIVNLVVNARDAMPNGGRLTLKTANVQLSKADAAAQPAVAPGAYVMLSVSDTGQGMTAEVQQHLFEPFFTTKEQGKGTGLGLSTSYGIIKQSGGHVLVDSEAGRGTVFRIYLPRVCEAPQAAEQRRVTRGLRGSETILLVDDDDGVRASAQRILRSRGYTVVAAGSGPEASAKATQHPGEIHLVLSDVVMPGESGPDLVRRLRAARPGIRVLFMSGFTEHAVLDKALAEGANYLQKPFTPDTLADRVRTILDRAKGH